MDLKDLLKRYPHIRVAKESDNDLIIDFYKKLNDKSLPQSKLHFHNDDFFKFIRERSKDYLVFILENSKKDIEGISIISYRDGFIDGKSTIVGYLGDLRLISAKDSDIEWHKFFAEFMKYSEYMDETFCCKYYQVALKTSSDLDIKGIKFSPLVQYEMVNIIGVVLKLISASRFKVTRATSEDKEDIVRFLEKDHKKRNFGLHYPEEFERRLETWENFDISNWIICRRKKEIVAITYTWNPRDSKAYTVSTVPRIEKVKLKILKYTPLIRLSKIPKDNSILNILYLGQITFTNDYSNFKKQRILKAFLRFLFMKNQKFTSLAYCNFQVEDLFQRTPGIFYEKSPMTLYSVHYHEDDCIKYPISPTGKAPAFDLAYL